MPELFVPRARPRTIGKQGAATTAPRTAAKPVADDIEDAIAPTPVLLRKQGSAAPANAPIRSTPPAKPVPDIPLEEAIAQLPFVAKTVAEVLLLRDPQEARRYVWHIRNRTSSTGD